MNGRPGHRHLLQPARKAFGKALAATRKTLQNPTEIRKDETLISVLLMGFAEVSLEDYHLLAPWYSAFELD